MIVIVIMLAYNQTDNNKTKCKKLKRNGVSLRKIYKNMGFYQITA